MNAAKKESTMSRHFINKIAKRPGNRLAMTSALALASLAGMNRMASANPVSLGNGNSLVTINPISSGTTTQDGVTTYDVNGVNQIKQQWFWLRVGGSGPGYDLGSAQLPLTADVAFSTVGSLTENNYASFTYTGKDLSVTLSYLLSGGTGTSNQSDLSTSIRITNTGQTTQTFNEADLSDFTLGQPNATRGVTITDRNTGLQTSPSGGREETIVAMQPSEAAAGDFTALENDLNNGAFPLTNSSSASSSNSAYAFESDVTLAPGSSLVIGTDQELETVAVPEPTSAAALAGLGGIFLMRPRRRDEDSDPRVAHVAGA